MASDTFGVETWEQQVHFRDSRSPHEIKVQLERDLMTLFWPHWNGPQFSFKGEVKSGIPTRFELRFDAAFSWINCYAFRVESSWTSLPAGRQGGNASSLASWFKFWTRDFKICEPTEPGEGSAERYRILVEQALSAESDLVDAGAVQQAILAALRGGASFSTAHKEGGTTIKARGRQFIRADYGESSHLETFDDETAFLTFLRKFYDWETSKGFYPDKAPEFEAWKLILRLLRW